MLSDANVLPMLPVKDFEGAKKFYEKTLALRKVDEMPGTAVTYRSGKDPDGNILSVQNRPAKTNRGQGA